MKYVLVALMLVALVFAIVATQGVPITLSSEENPVKRSISQHRAAFTSYLAHDESDSMSPDEG
ncbi:AGAP003473-PA [Anopheles gambiae str. PEST]|uniref:AGAP003473-PA n=1 Tax=Anopheles gambiae TaxID=7165 RepID=Q7QDF0_ANOGA|nr:AGAP003473-PA [Anopheles gambiae str. PEST]